jgi:hypothetical protein
MEMHGAELLRLDLWDRQFDLPERRMFEKITFVIAGVLDLCNDTAKLGSDHDPLLLGAVVTI